MSASYPAKRTMFANNIRSGTHHAFPEDLQTHGLFMVFNKYEFETNRGLLNNQKVNASVGDSILLPIPSSIADTYNMNIRNYDRNHIGDAIATGAKTAMNSGGMDSLAAAMGNEASAVLPDQRALVSTMLLETCLIKQA
jgi:hypothetical protein